ncbi:Choline dehydrogenase [Candidatus Rhodobacter oscarellae]|uniref:Choline dehydrogenase n=1 Tax=Candidatus Rhodobacter oscarellae TaxID=1675527 RepID=A0A0J9E6T5_9RHOB|nr:GMC family oxidoreductase N-terminal domain-containing protein [Candidatus Rhodobacter lobularis]KMW58485.1 Choline dehydrogenase [Candidatus Rhodobacter lobularis]
MEEFDYVIVGAGSAGCVLAARLVERTRHSVCLIEAGPADWHPMIHLPVGWMKLMRNARFNWMYEAEPSDWTGGRRIPVPRGKTLGGSSAINGNVFNRGAPSDFDHWAQLGNPGWDYASVLPSFRDLETWLGPDQDGARGRGGPLAVTPTDWTHPICEAFLDGAETLGIPRNPDYNAGAQFGAAYSQRTIAAGRRQSAARAFLQPNLKNPNLRVLTKSHATEISFEGKTATGVLVRRGGRSFEVKARREVILAGGVINSPQLLQLSGIGDPAHLGRIGVALRHALPGVGQNLRDHYTPRFTARVKGTQTFNERTRGMAFAGEVAKWLAGRPSVLSLPSTVCYAFAKSNPVLDESDLQITFMPASYKEGNQSQLDDLPGMTLAAWQQRPESTGTVLARSSDPFEKPQIQPNYLSAPEDRRVLLAGLRLARQLMRTPPMQPFFAGEIYPGDAMQSDEELLQTAVERGTTTFHMIGTCRMGPRAQEGSVVDHQLRVHGLRNLRVVDASIMPTMPAANTNAAALLIGEMGASFLT